MNSVPVLIVGAGPTGLVLALWLKRAGVNVRIIDKTAEGGTTSRALAVQGRTLEFYQQLGIADEVIAAGVRITYVNLWVKGKLAARLPLQTMGEKISPYPFVLIFPQDAHEKLLIEELKKLGVEVERRTELLSFASNNNAVDCEIQLPDGRKESVTAQYLAGCDGAHSAVRSQLKFDFPGGTYDQLFYVADAEGGGPCVDGDLHVGLDQAELLLLFPMKGDGRVRLVGTVRENDGVTSKLTFDDVSSVPFEKLKLTIKKVFWFSTYHVHHRVSSHFRLGRVFLLGDAAHIHSPAGGQGMNTGIGDAINLAWKLAAVIQQQASHSLLDTFEPERLAFARKLVATTDRIFNIATAQGSFARFVRMRIAPRALGFLTRFNCFRTFLYRTVSQTEIEYRKSKLSEGRAGRIVAGDRLPWQGENFAPLKSLAWQMHVYGEPQPAFEQTCERLRIPIHRFSGETSALFLIRPDGYIAWAKEKCGGPELERYWKKWGLSQ